jgi:hypothetical protein
MPGEHGYDNEEKERKQRIKKMKAKTSKMRLAIVEDSPYMKESIPKNTTSSSNPELLKLKNIAIKAQKEENDWGKANETDTSGKFTELMHKTQDANKAYRKKYDALGLDFTSEP